MIKTQVKLSKIFLAVLGDPKKFVFSLKLPSPVLVGTRVTINVINKILINSQIIFNIKIISNFL